MMSDWSNELHVLLKIKLTSFYIAFDWKWFVFLCSPKQEKVKRKFTFFLVNTKNISSCAENISNFTCTCEITDIFNTFDEIYLVFTSEK